MPTAKNWLIGGILMTAAASTAAIAVSCRQLTDSGPLNTETQSQAYQHRITRIEFDLKAGNVKLTSGEAGQVSVSRRLKWRNTKPTFAEDWRGDTLHVTSDCADQKNCTIDFTVSVPANVAVVAHTDAGDLSIRDITGGLDLSNDAGEVTVENASGRVRVQGKAGNVTGTRLRSSDVEVRTKSGEVTLAFAAPPTTTTVTLEAGSIKVAVPRTGGGADGYHVQASTKAGQRQVTVDEDSTGRRSIVAQLDSGDVTITYA